MGLKDKQDLSSVLDLDTITPPDYGVSIYDVVLFFIGFASLCAMALIALNKFNVPILLVASVGFTMMYVVFVRKKITIKNARFTQIPFVLILIIAVIFRLGKFTHFRGGQDQGLYVSMSSTLVRNGGMDIYDAFRASLPTDLRSIYDYEDNLANGGRIYLLDANKSLDQINFYPLNGVWLAIFGTVLGLGNHGYATQFFSLLVVIGVYILTLELTDHNKKAACIAMLFAAMNPAFVFFSKFPVSETVAMAFSVNGFYLIAKAIRCENKSVRISLATSSVLLLGMYNFIRMTFVLLLPTIAIILISVFLFSELRKYRLTVILYVAGVVILFTLSWIYYYLYQPTLIGKIFGQTYLPLIQKYLFLIGIIVLVSAGLIGVFFRFRDWLEKAAKWTLKKLSYVSAWFLLIVLALSIIQVIELITKGYTSGGITLITGNEFYNFRFSGIYNFMLLLSPFAFALLIILPFLKIRFSKTQVILILTITTIWIGIGLTGYSVILYKYYFTRYLTSEMLLYCIILVAIVLVYMLDRGGKLNKIAKIIIATTALFFLFFSTPQVGRAETENPQIYYKLNKIIGSNDAVVSFLPEELSFPLRFYFGKYVFQLSTDENALNTEVLNRLFDSGAYDNIYVLTYSPNDQTLAACGMDFIGKYNYEYGYFSDSAHRVPYASVKPANVFQFLLPLVYMYDSSDIYLYKLKSNISEIDFRNNLFVRCGKASK